MSRTKVLIALAIAIAAPFLCAFQVEEGSAAIVSRFGAPRRTVEEPGLYFKWPFPIDQVVPIDMRTHVLDTQPAEYLTLDKKNVIVDPFVAWRVEDPLRFHVRVRDRKGAEQRLSDLVRSVVGDVLSSHPFSDLVSVEPRDLTMDDVAEAITAAARHKARESYGIEVAMARIKRLNFPVQNRSAVFRRMEAEREATAAAFRSEGIEQYEKIKAETDREQAELLAEAGRKAAEIKGDADAEATRIYAEAVGKDPELYSFLRSLEVLDEVLGEGTTVILPDDHPLMRALSGPVATPGKAPGVDDG